MGSTAKQYEYLTNLGYTGTLADKQNAYFTDLIANGGQPDIPTTGEYVPERELWDTNLSATASGMMLLSYFTSRRSEAINTITTISGSTAAAATPTLCRVGVYSVASSGDLTLVAQSANTTSMWSSTNTAYAVATEAAFNKVAGQRYACAMICVTGGALPTLVGKGGFAIAAVGTHWFSTSPRLFASITGQTDLPASIANASLASTVPRRVGFRLS